MTTKREGKYYSQVGGYMWWANLTLIVALVVTGNVWPGIIYGVGLLAGIILGVLYKLAYENGEIGQN